MLEVINQDFCKFINETFQFYNLKYLKVKKNSVWET